MWYIYYAILNSSKKMNKTHYPEHLLFSKNAQDSKFCLYFGRIKNTINCFHILDEIHSLLNAFRLKKISTNWKWNFLWTLLQKKFISLSSAYLFLVCISQIFHASLGFTRRCISNRCLVGSTNQACSSGFYFWIAWKSTNQPSFLWNCSLSFLRGLKSTNRS